MGWWVRGLVVGVRGGGLVGSGEAGGWGVCESTRSHHVLYLQLSGLAAKLWAFIIGMHHTHTHLLRAVGDI